MTEAIQIQLKKGALELCVLALLAHRESYAYEIASTLADRVGMGEGTIYPLMRRMQSDGLVATYLVESPSGPSRKYYRLTDAGRTALGDYWAGPSHVLPTMGNARFSSGLSVATFLKRTSYVEYSKQAAKSAAANVTVLASAEGMRAHQESINVRTREIK